MATVVFKLQPPPACARGQTLFPPPTVVVTHDDPAIQDGKPTFLAIALVERPGSGPSTRTTTKVLGTGCIKAWSGMAVEYPSCADVLEGATIVAGQAVPGTAKDIAFVFRDLKFKDEDASEGKWNIVVHIKNTMMGWRRDSVPRSWILAESESNDVEVKKSMTPEEVQAAQAISDEDATWLRAMPPPVSDN